MRNQLFYSFLILVTACEFQNPSKTSVDDYENADLEEVYKQANEKTNSVVFCY